MALLTATELKTSREAIKAGVNGVSDAEATTAIAEATSELYAVLGYKIEDTATSITLRGDGDWLLYSPSRIRTVSSISEDGTALGTTLYQTRVRGFVLYNEAYPWTAETIVVTGTFGYVSTDSQWELAKRAVKLLAVRYLQGTKTGTGLPTGAPGAYLTGYQSENASFTFFTPQGDEKGTGYADIDRFVRLIGRHPLSDPNALRSVPISHPSL